MEKNIVSIRTYQAVRFNKKAVDFISKLKDTSVSFTILESIGVELKSPTHNIIVPFANIAEISLDNEFQKEKREAIKVEKSKPAKPQKINRPK